MRKVILLTILCFVSSQAFATLPVSVNDREYGKFQEDSAGNITIRATMSPGSTILNTGNVGIGTITATNQLTVNGGVGIGTANSAGFVRTVAPAGGLLVEGNVGIGSSAPGKKLDVTGDIRLSGQYFGDGSQLTGITSPWTESGTNIYPTTVTNNIGIGTVTPSAELEIESTAANDLFIVSDNGPGDVTPFVIQSNGNVGIGTHTTGAAVQIGSGASPMDTELSIISAGPELGFAESDQTSPAGRYEIWVNGDALRFSRDSEFMTLNNGGNLGIGTTNPGQRLDVSGGIRLTSTDNFITNSNWLSGDGGDEGVFVDSGGNVGINDGTPTEAKLVIQNAAGTANGAWNENSHADGIARYYARNNSSSAVVMQIGGSTVAGTLLGANQAGNAHVWAGTSLFIGTNDNVSLGFSTNDLRRMTITGGGNVGIGTVGPTGQFALSNAAAQAGQAACWTTNGVIGYCTTVVGAGGACTCTGL